MSQTLHYIVHVIKHSVNLSYHGISQNVFYKTQIPQDTMQSKMFPWANEFWEILGGTFSLHYLNNVLETLNFIIKV